MFVGIVSLKIYIPFSHSLKDKRRVVKSVCAKVRNNFNVSIGEIGNQDMIQTIELGFAYVSNDKRHIDSVVDKVLNYIRGNTEGEIIGVNREIV